MLPDGVPDSDANMGMIVGPPPLTPLGLPLETEVRLHNALHDRELFTLLDVTKRREHVVGAIMSALKVDAQHIVDLYTLMPPPTQIDKAPPDQVRSLNGVSVMRETASGEVVPNTSDVRERTTQRPRRKTASRTRRKEQ